MLPTIRASEGDFTVRVRWDANLTAHDFTGLSVSRFARRVPAQERKWQKWL